MVKTRLIDYATLFVLISFFYGCTVDSDRKNSSPLAEQVDSLNTIYTKGENNFKNKNLSLTALDNYISGATELGIDSLAYKGYMLKTRILSYHKDFNTAIVVSNELLKLANKNKDSSYIGKANYKLGLYNYYRDNYLKAFDYYNKSFKFHRDIKDSIMAIRRLLAMSNTQAILGDYIGSNITAVDGLNYVTATPDFKILLGLYHSIAISFREQKNYKQALVWNTKAIELSKKPEVFEKVGVRNILKFRNTRANILSDTKQFDEAVDILQDLLQEALVLKDSTEYARFLSNLGRVKWLGDSLNAKSEVLFLRALEIRKKNNSIPDLVSSNMHLAEYYFNHNKEKAMFFAQRAYDHSEVINNKPASLEALNILTALDTNAILYYKELKKINASLLDAQRKTRQIYEPTRFENERLTAEKEENKRQVQKQKTQKKWIIILSALTLIGILIYMRQQFMIHKEKEQRQEEKNKAEKTLAIYQTENRISKKVHDTIANGIYLTKLLISNEQNSARVLDKLNDIYHIARDISRENAEIDFKIYAKELNSMILSYISDTTNVFVMGLETIHWNQQLKPNKIIIYKIIQELMTNMSKHSMCSIVSVVFKHTSDQLEIIYTDNGVGLNSNSNTRKNGLAIMENRIKTIGGTLIFDTCRENGTKLTFHIPLSN